MVSSCSAWETNLKMVCHIVCEGRQGPGAFANPLSVTQLFFWGMHNEEELPFQFLSFFLWSRSSLLLLHCASCTLSPILHSLQEQLQAAQQAHRNADSLAAAADSAGNKGGGRPPRTSANQHPAAATPHSGQRQPAASGSSQPKAALTTEPASGAEHSLGGSPPSAPPSATEPSHTTPLLQPERSAVTEPEGPASQSAAASFQPGQSEAHASRPQALATCKLTESCGHLRSAEIPGDEVGPAVDPQVLDDNRAYESAPNAAAGWSAEALQWKQHCRDLETQVMQLEYKLAMAELRQTVGRLLQCESDYCGTFRAERCGVHRTSALKSSCTENHCIKSCLLAQSESLLISNVVRAVQQTIVDPMLSVKTQYQTTV